MPIQMHTTFFNLNFYEVLKVWNDIPRRDYDVISTANKPEVVVFIIVSPVTSYIIVT